MPRPRPLAAGAIAWAALLAWGAAAAPALAQERLWGLGPLDLRNEFVLSLTHLTLAADSPATLRQDETAASVRLEWGQTIVRHARTGAVLDAETVEAALAIRYGWNDVLELRLEAPAAWRGPGALDEVVENVEDYLLAEPAADRGKRPPNEYLVAGLTDDGKRFDLPPGLGPAKVRLGAKVRLTDATSLEGLVALPTGRPDFGTNDLDYGLRVAGALPLGPLWIYGGGSVVFLGDPRIQGVHFERTKWAGFLAGEVPVNGSLSVVYQGWVESPTTRNLSGGNTLVYHGGGVKMRAARWFLELGLVENGFDVSRSADFALHVLFGLRFGEATRRLD